MSNSTQSPNGDSSVHEWLMHIDGKITEMHGDLRDKLDTKASKEDLEEVEEKVEAVDKRTSKIELKMAGIAGAISVGVLGLKSTITSLFGG